MSLQDNTPSLAVDGVTSGIGQEFLSFLANRDFPYRPIKILALKRYAKYFDIVDIALFSVVGSINKEFDPLIVDRGTIIVDNRSAFHMEEGVPLVISEVSSGVMKGTRVRNGKGALITNLNFSTIICLMVATPLHHHSKVVHMVVSTYQTAGDAAMRELEQQTHEVREGKSPTCKIFQRQFRTIDTNRKLRDQKQTGRILKTGTCYFQYHIYAISNTYYV
ncbi:hypothetical protein UlMin_014140 [Ulmus minor]